MTQLLKRLKPRTRRAKLQARADKLGLCFDDYSPGDGITRYRFGLEQDSQRDYFGMRKFHTAFGPKAAEAFLTGVETAFEILSFSRSHIG